MHIRSEESSGCRGKHGLGLYNVPEIVKMKTMPWQLNFESVRCVTCDLESALSSEKYHTE